MRSTPRADLQRETPPRVDLPSPSADRGGERVRLPFGLTMPPESPMPPGLSPPTELRIVTGALDCHR
ncbi:hypothetical protein ACERIT_12515 [Halopenitus sp. H-Gu1]|uniref:hypothetical protein n=1 Tax=Halopenitus sp. H-Gu1 TaxID=3242697 RepID=UPI00359EDAB7